MLRITVGPWECTARLEEEGGRVKNRDSVQEAIALRQQAHSGVLDSSLERMSEALSTGLCQQKGQGIKGWLAYKVF